MRRGNLQVIDPARKDCFASLAMTVGLGLTLWHSIVSPKFQATVPGIYAPDFRGMGRAVSRCLNIAMVLCE
jgi:ABC-type phosphate transport system permease subunit